MRVPKFNIPEFVIAAALQRLRERVVGSPLPLQRPRHRGWIPAWAPSTNSAEPDTFGVLWKTLWLLRPRGLGLLLPRWLWEQPQTLRLTHCDIGELYAESSSVKRH